ncbi:MAG TPA: AMP-binding protein [Anaerolineaceae bacterium]
MSTLPQVLWDAGQQVPEQVAIYLQHAHQPDLSIRYRDLLTGGVKYARLLEQHGILPGDVVILILQHGIDLVYGFWGAILHGAIPSIMPFLTEKLLPEKYRADLASLIAVTKPVALITYPDFVEEAKAALTQGGPVRAVISTDPGTHHDERGDVDVLTTMGGFRRQPEDVVLLQHSSGTTGLQKGVALSHQAVLRHMTTYSEAIRLSTQDVIVSWLPLYHDMGLIAGFLMPILTRTPLVLMSPFDWVRAPYRLLQAVSRYHGTLTWLPNFAYNFCVSKIRDRDLEGVDLSSWRSVINCSEPMRWESHARFYERFAPFGLRESALATCYAMAENTFAVSQGGIDGEVVWMDVDRDILQLNGIAQPPSEGGVAVRMLSAGKPIRGVDVRVLSSEGTPLGDYIVGELAVKSDTMLTGYYNRPDLTEKAFVDGYYLTGDLGFTGGGEVYVSGRKKDLMIVGGRNIYPQDLEELAGTVPGVHPGRMVVFGVFDEITGTEEVVAIVEADTESQEEREQIAAQVREKVTRGSAVVLRRVQVVDAHWLIKTSSGKISRFANRQKYLQQFCQQNG